MLFVRGGCRFSLGREQLIPRSVFLSSLRRQCPKAKELSLAKEYNTDLSQRRANHVVRTLVERYGVAPDRLLPIGLGKSKPQVPNVSDENRETNRRVEFVRIGRFEG